MSEKHDLLKNIEKIHTTELGLIRIKSNLKLDIESNNIVDFCKELIQSKNATISRKGKNWYVEILNNIITVNTYSYTIITAHKKRVIKNSLNQN